MIGGELEDQHAAVRLAILGLLHVQDLVAVAHPRGSTAEAGVGKALEGLLLARDLLQGRRQQFAQDDLDADPQQSRDENAERQPPNRDAGRARAR